jgi:hypothetical protein
VTDKTVSKVHETRIGTVTVSESDDDIVEPAKDASAHTELQWFVLTFGSEPRLDLWVARNDRGRSYRGRAFADLPRLRTDLPRQFDKLTQLAIELIDVLWLRSNAIVAAFELGSTTSIYSGLPWMADVLVMRPKLILPLYIVAPEERREKVLTRSNGRRCRAPTRQ